MTNLFLLSNKDLSYWQVGILCGAVLFYQKLAKNKLYFVGFLFVRVLLNPKILYPYFQDWEKYYKDGLPKWADYDYNS